MVTCAIKNRYLDEYQLSVKRELEHYHAHMLSRPGPRAQQILEDPRVVLCYQIYMSPNGIC